MRLYELYDEYAHLDEPEDAFRPAYFGDLRTAHTYAKSLCNLGSLRREDARIALTSVQSDKKGLLAALARDPIINGRLRVWKLTPRLGLKEIEP